MAGRGGEDVDDSLGGHILREVVGNASVLTTAKPAQGGFYTDSKTVGSLDHLSKPGKFHRGDDEQELRSVGLPGLKEGLGIDEFQLPGEAVEFPDGWSHDDFERKRKLAERRVDLLAIATDRERVAASLDWSKLEGEDSDRIRELGNGLFLDLWTDVATQVEIRAGNKKSRGGTIALRRDDQFIRLTVANFGRILRVAEDKQVVLPSTKRGPSEVVASWTIALASLDINERRLLTREIAMYKGDERVELK